MKSYIDLINHYWEIFKRYKLTPMEGYFYFYILNILNRAGWQSANIPNAKIMGDLEISDRILRRIRDKLIRLELIDFRQGKNQREYPKYTLPNDSNVRAEVRAELLLHGNSEDGGQIIDYKYITDIPRPYMVRAKDTPQCKGGGKGVPIIDKDNKTIKKENIKRKKAENSGLALKFESPKKESKRQDEFQPPSLEDVIMLCVGKGISEDEAKRFFFYYDAQGWVTSSGQKIKRIDSMVNRWMSNKKDKDDGKFKDEHTKARERNDEIARDILSRYT